MLGLRYLAERTVRTRGRRYGRRAKRHLFEILKYYSQDLAPVREDLKGKAPE